MSGCLLARAPFGRRHFGARAIAGVPLAGYVVVVVLSLLLIAAVVVFVRQRTRG